MEKFLATCLLYVLDLRLHLILALIGIDLILGICVAIRAGVFQWKKVGRFYQTNVIPYMLGYLVVYMIYKLVPAMQGVIGEAIHLLLYGALLAGLIGSIFANVKNLGIKPVPR